jgi:hypothetical protein
VKKSNPAAEPHGSPQGCTVRPRKGRRTEFDGGEVFSVLLQNWGLGLSPFFKQVKGAATPVVNPVLTLSFSKTAHTQRDFTDHWMELRVNTLIGCETRCQTPSEFTDFSIRLKEKRSLTIRLTNTAILMDGWSPLNEYTIGYMNRNFCK